MRNHKLNTIFELREIADYDDKVTNNVGIAKVLDNWQILKYKRLCLCVCVSVCRKWRGGNFRASLPGSSSWSGARGQSIQADQEYRKYAWAGTRQHEVKCLLPSSIKIWWFKFLLRKIRKEIRMYYDRIDEIVKRLGLGLGMGMGNENREFPQSQKMTV